MTTFVPKPTVPQRTLTKCHQGKCAFSLNALTANDMGDAVLSAGNYFKRDLRYQRYGRNYETTNHFVFAALA